MTGNDVLLWIERDTENATPLARLMRFAGVTEADVRRSVVARNALALYVDADRQIRRQGEVNALERQWNPLGRHDDWGDQ